MKKSSFAALVLGTVSGVLFSLGMCMALVTEWGTLTEGIILGCAGLAMALATLLVWRKMEKKAPLHVSGKTVMQVLYGVVSAIVFGLGLCLCLVSGNYILGTIVGLAGGVMLLALIPMVKGLK